MGADNIDTPPPPDSPVPGSDKALGGPDASPRGDEATPATDLDLRPIQDIEPVHRAPTGETRGDADPAATTSADSPLSRIGTYRDERTPATDAADSPANTTGPDSPALALPGDEGHSLTTETGPRADRSKGWADKLKHGALTVVAGLNMGAQELVPPTVELSRLPSAEVSQTMVSAADAVGEISDAKDQAGKLFTEISAVVRGEPDQSGIGGGAAEHLAAEPNPEIPVDEAPDPGGPDEPDSSLSDDLNIVLGREKDREEEEAEAEKAALERRLPDRFPRAQSSPKTSDQVRDRRPMPTGRGRSRGRPK